MRRRRPTMTSASPENPAPMVRVLGPARLERSRTRGTAGRPRSMPAGLTQVTFAGCRAEALVRDRRRRAASRPGRRAAGPSPRCGTASCAWRRSPAHATSASRSPSVDHRARLQDEAHARSCRRTARRPAARPSPTVSSVSTPRRMLDLSRASRSARTCSSHVACRDAISRSSRASEPRTSACSPSVTATSAWSRVTSVSARPDSIQAVSPCLCDSS